MEVLLYMQDGCNVFLKQLIVFFHNKGMKALSIVFHWGLPDILIVLSQTCVHFCFVFVSFLALVLVSFFLFLAATVAGLGSTSVLADAEFSFTASLQKARSGRVMWWWQTTAPWECFPTWYYLYVSIHKGRVWKKRSFQSAWLLEFPCLCDSESCNGGFCILCFLFAKHHFSLGQLVIFPMINFTLAKLSLEKSSKQTCHVMASMDAIDFKIHMERGVPSA